MIKQLLILLSWLFCSYTYGQSLQLGLLPDKYKWYQLDHDSIQVIYNLNNEDLAYRVGSLMIDQARHESLDSSGRFEKIPILLQPSTNVSNGYVGLAPYLSEFYLQPSQSVFELGSLSWSDLLALHEFRHVQQINAAHKGITSLARSAFGELAFSGLYALSVPTWFREGDAVFAETKYSLQGRGRLNFFLQTLHEKMLEGKPWGFYKARRGSYKEITPNDYDMGYAMITYGNHVFGENTWKDILQQAPRFKYPFNPFGGIVKEYYGKANPGLYYDAMQWYSQKWKDDKLQDILYPLISIKHKKQENDYSSFEYPSPQANNSVTAVVTTFDKISTITQIDSVGKLKSIIALGLQDDPYFDQHKDRFVWGEFITDPRWRRKDKHVLFIYNETSGQKIRIEGQKGLFMPSFNDTGQKIAALHTDENGNHAIQIFNSENGDLILQIPNPSNYYYGYPQLLPDDKYVIASTRDELGRMFLAKIDVVSGNCLNLTTPSYKVIGKSELYLDYILFTVGFSEWDQVFGLELTTGKILQVSDGLHAHYNPIYDASRNKILCSEYSLKGYKIVELSASPDDWFQLKQASIDDGHNRTELNLLQSVPADIEFEKKRYNSFSHLINFHSLSLRANDPDWGVEVLSQNILQTVDLSAGYEFDRNTKSHGPFANLTLGMWYPQFSFGVQRLTRRINHTIFGNVNQVNDLIRTGVHVPLVFAGGSYRQTFIPSIKANWLINKIRPAETSLPDIPINFATYDITFVNARRKAYRQIVPSFAQYFYTSYKHQINRERISQFYANVEMALPDLFNSHYWLLRGEVLIQELGEEYVQLSSPYFGPRGFQLFDGKRHFAASLTYGFPLVYPDFGLGNILYTRRIRMQAFYDIGRAEYVGDPDIRQQSIGIELLFDFQLPEITFGIRFSKPIRGGTDLRPSVEVFLPAKHF